MRMVLGRWVLRGGRIQAVVGGIELNLASRKPSLFAAHATPMPRAREKVDNPPRRPALPIAQRRRNVALREFGREGGEGGA